MLDVTRQRSIDLHCATGPACTSCICSGAMVLLVKMRHGTPGIKTARRLALVSEGVSPRLNRLNCATGMGMFDAVDTPAISAEAPPPRTLPR